jgi:adenosine deaminase
LNRTSSRTSTHADDAARPADPRLADCHLHFEGSLSFRSVQRLARAVGHRFADRDIFEQKRRSLRDAAGFLAIFAEICRLFRKPEDYLEAAREMPLSLAAGGVRYAEIYVSPEIFSRVGLDPLLCLEAVDEGLASGSAESGISCRVLLDAVRHWGPDSAERVLDLYERRPLASVVGFGLGGDEQSGRAADFAGVYARARGLGLKTSVHAGEWAGPESVEEALNILRPDRIDHGIAAAENPGLLRRLAAESVVLCVAASGNAATGACPDLATHPLARLLEAGVAVALSADDPLLFGTTTWNEYLIARDRIGVSPEQLRRIAENSWRAAFCDEKERRQGLQRLEGLSFSDEEPQTENVLSPLS